MIEINTEVINKYGNEIIELSQSLNQVIQDLYTRLINVPTVTLEWQGESALAFAEKLKKEKLVALQLKDSIYKCGETLVKNAENYQNTIKQVVDKDYVTKMHFDRYNVKNNLDYINTAYNMMYKAVYYPGTINVPVSFKYANYLKNVINGNSSIMKSLSSNKNLLDESVAKYDSVIEENETIINEISKVFQQEI